MQASPLVMVVDDQEGILRSIERILVQMHIRCITFLNPREALEFFRRERPDLLITDLRLPEMDGLQLMKAMQALGGAPEVIIITGHGTVEAAVGAMKQGAYDFLEKPFDRSTLQKLVQKALEKRRLVRENQELRSRLAGIDGPIMVGQTPRMRVISELVQQVAPTSATVLIQGESGTGKELVADTIHRLSSRRERPFVKVNCAGLPESLLESELFGHERGAFTDAVEAHPGKFEQANGGTLFLDEVGEMSPAMQVKLLRVLQEREVERLGGSHSIHVDVRFLAATNSDLDELVRQGQFRQDLYYRLNVINLHLPPLRERRDDIPLLAHHFLRKFSRQNGKNVSQISQGAMEQILRHSWPGNIRELQNVIERAVILCKRGEIDVSDLPERVLHTSGAQPPSSMQDSQTAEQTDISIPFATKLKDLERLYVTQTLLRLGGDKNLAAHILGVNLRTIYRKL